MSNERLEYLRSQIEAECISMGEIAELQSMADQIDDGDVLLLEWAGVPEFPPEDQMTELASIPSTQTERINGFVEGANKMLANMPNPTGNDPMKIEPEFRNTGNCHIWLVTGKWEEIDGEPCEVYPVLRF